MEPAEPLPPVPCGSASETSAHGLQLGARNGEEDSALGDGAAMTGSGRRRRRGAERQMRQRHQLHLESVMARLIGGGRDVGFVVQAEPEDGSTGSRRRTRLP